MSRDIPQLTQRRPNQEKRRSWQISTPKATTKVSATDEWSLSEASYPSLLKKKKERLEELCADRDLLVVGEHGYSKREMILLLLRWRDTQFGVSQNKEIKTFVQRNTPRPRPARPSHPPDLPLLSDPAFLLQDLHISSDEPERKDPFTPSPTPTPPNVDESLPEAVLDLDALNMASKRISPAKLQKGKKIGSGGFKDVFKGKYGKYRVAIADLRATRLTKGDIQELGLLRDFNHENILRFIGVCIPPDPNIPVQIVTELALNGDLFKYIRTVPAPPLLAMLELMLGCAKGLNYLHTRRPPVVHRDIKSLNILISSKGIAKINDFGLARVKNTIASMCQTSVGTLNWQAPELWVAQPSYTFSIDVYAMGLTFWELLNWWNPDKTYPFHGMNEHAIYLEVGKNKLRPSTSALRKRYGFIVINVVHAMWSQKPEERPRMSEVVEALEWMIVEERAERLSKEPY